MFHNLCNSENIVHGGDNTKEVTVPVSSKEKVSCCSLPLLRSHPFMMSKLKGPKDRFESMPLAVASTLGGLYSSIPRVGGISAAFFGFDFRFCNHLKTVSGDGTVCCRRSGILAPPSTSSKFSFTSSGRKSSLSLEITESGSDLVSDIISISDSVSQTLSGSDGASDPVATTEGGKDSSSENMELGQRCAKKFEIKRSHFQRLQNYSNFQYTSSPHEHETPNVTIKHVVKFHSA